MDTGEGEVAGDAVPSGALEADMAGDLCGMADRVSEWWIDGKACREEVYRQANILEILRRGRHASERAAVMSGPSANCMSKL